MISVLTSDMATVSRILQGLLMKLFAKLMGHAICVVVRVLMSAEVAFILMLVTIQLSQH
jgi:hypothetical protein